MIGIRQAAIIEKFYQNFKNSIYNFVPENNNIKLTEFQKALFGENVYQQNEAFNNWMYKNRPSNKCYYCVQDGKVVGQQSAISMCLKFGDKQINAAYAVDLRIRSDWKMKGLGVALMASLMHEYDVIIGIGVSDEAYKMFMRQGWFDLGLINALVKPLNMRGFNHKGFYSGIIPWLKYVLALPLSRLSNCYRNLLSFFNKGDFRKISCFTDEHEDLMNKIYSPDIISFVKDKAYFNWRYLEFPENENYESYELIENNKPVAFFITYMLSTQKCDVMIISEIHSQKSHLGQVVDEIVRLAISKNACRITYSGLDNDILRILKSRLFFNRPYGERFLVFSKYPDIEPILREKSNWRICGADSDAEFYLLNK